MASQQRLGLSRDWPLAPPRSLGHLARIPFGVAFWEGMDVGKTFTRLVATAALAVPCAPALADAPTPLSGESFAIGNAGAANPRVALARFFAENLATAAGGLKETIVSGADAALLLEPEALAG